MDSFSEELLELARPNLAWVSEQLDLFDQLVPVGATSFRLNAAEHSVTRAGVTFQGHLLGSYALDGTWLWAWGNDTIGDIPGVARSRELQALGQRRQIPEFTAPLLDLNGFPDPRLAADHLLLISMGLLDMRGGLIVATNARGRSFLVVDDEAVPRAEPRVERFRRALITGSSMLPGPAEPAVEGWFTRHGVIPVRGSDQITGVLAGGDIVSVMLDDHVVDGVFVTGAGGGAPACAGVAEQRLMTKRSASPDRPVRLFPAGLLPVAAEELAYSFQRTRSMAEHARSRLGFSGTAPDWSETTGELVFPSGALRARHVGDYDPGRRVLRWARNTDDLRAPLRSVAGAKVEGEVPELPELDGRPLDLAPYIRGGDVAAVLVRTAVGAAGGIFTSVGHRFFMIQDDFESEHRELAEVGEDIETAAQQLHGMTPPELRHATMRSVAVAGLERVGLAVWNYGLPEFLSGVSGAYELRIWFDNDGTITKTTTGMLGYTSG
jgi:hypothetical protein